MTTATASSSATEEKRTAIPKIVLVWAALALLLIGLAFVQVDLRDARFDNEVATLAPNLWLPTFGFDDNTIIRIRDFDTGIPLLAFVVLVGVLEGVLSYAFHEGNDRLLRPLLRAAAIFLVFWSFFGHLPVWDALLGMLFPRSSNLLYPRTTLVRMVGQHLELVVISSLITVTVGLAIGILVTRTEFREFLPIVSDFISAGQTTPTLAIVAIMVPIIGLGFWPTIIALILYGMLPVVRNTIAGLEAVDGFMIDSARGMGMTAWQILWQIELPTASRIILAGVRTSVVINVGTATLGAYAGADGLGTAISGGLAQNVIPYVLYGALPAALLAILVDYVLGRIEFVLTPEGLLIES